VLAQAAVEQLQREASAAKAVARQSLGGGHRQRNKSRLSIDVVFSPGGKLPRKVRSRVLVRCASYQRALGLNAVRSLNRFNGSHESTKVSTTITANVWAYGGTAA
jgi:hypothetical protein